MKLYILAPNKTKGLRVGDRGLSGVFRNNFAEVFVSCLNGCTHSEHKKFKYFSKEATQVILFSCLAENKLQDEPECLP